MVLEILSKDRLTSGVSVVESHVSEGQEVYMPGTKDAFEFGFCEFRFSFPAFDFHSFAAEGTLVFGEIPSSAIVREVWDTDIPEQGNGH